MHKSDSMAFSSYRPGPDKDVSPSPGLQFRMPVTTYLTSMIGAALAAAVPTMQFTPDQQFFRNSAAGRWQADYNTGAHAPLYQIKQCPNTGAVDVVRMEPCGSDYADLGGLGGIDYAARRP